MGEILQQCPICGANIEPSQRYPQAICISCIRTAVDAAGRPLRFFNESFSGGIYGVYQDNGAETYEMTCFIGGVECLAQEAHMGGIVIQPKR